MKKSIWILLVIVCAGYFYHSRASSPDMTFDVKPESLHLSGKNYDFVFNRLDDFEITGYVMGANHAGSGPYSIFSTTCGIVWGETAIEIASTPDDKKNDISHYSSEAQTVIRQQSCAANYLNKHISSLALVAENINLYSAMRNIKEKDMITLKGYKVEIKSAQFDDIPVQFDQSGFVCVTEAVINDKSFKE